ncbi:MAG TPA: hypothetical protein DCW90_02395 [Lachnospiraceae bacterium]|nr:hypothetical protein [Lachnospiraceae bacterium]
MNNKNDKLFYDAHAKNVIVECKNGRNLEDLIQSGDLVGSYDPSRMISILFMSTISDLESLSDSTYTWQKVGKLELAIAGVLTDFWLYLRNIGRNESIPSGTVIVAEFNNLATVSTLGGQWEQLGEMSFYIDENEKIFYAYKKL